MTLTPTEIRALRAETAKARARDFAQANGLTEAALVAAHVGHGATCIDPAPTRLVPMIEALGDVMALTRNESAVHERRGTYTGFGGGGSAAIVLGDEIDLRIFPAHWATAFAVEEPGEEGAVKRSLQVFDAHGEAVHKVFLKPESDVAAFAALVAALRLPDQADTVSTTPAPAPEGPRADPARREALLADWAAMTDTHQFVRIIKQHKMNRLGAYRLAGAPHAQALARDAVTRALEASAAGGFPIMIFVGNRGCIQIHSGPVQRIVPMGPWINVLDPRFNLHLRADHIAEVWLVEKPTRRGPAVSIEAFDAAGELILQMFPKRASEESAEGVDQWNAMARGLASGAHAPQTPPQTEVVPA